jgi:diguanylate cyclase (GGDEF)-like protein
MRASRRTIWMLLATGLLIGGVSASFLGATAVAREDLRDARQGLLSRSTAIASTLTLAISHEEDLAVSAGAFYADDQNATDADFSRWATSERAFERYPELLGVAVVKLVPEAQLAAFAAHEKVDSSGKLSPGGRFEVIPPGSRSFYCLSTVALARTPQLVLPAGFDYCDGGIAAALMRARDSGATLYIPDGPASIAVGNAIYNSSAIPETVAKRRADLIGWTGVLVRPSVLLAYALDGHPKTTAIELIHGSGSSRMLYESGRLAVGDDSDSIRLEDGWDLEAFVPRLPYGVFRNRDAVFLLLGGVAFSVLLGILIFVLGTSRARALGLVDEKTEQLEHQIFHDALTGLPNRRLILELIGEMRAGSRSVAVLILNLDNFKEINDNLGSDVADELVLEVGARLKACLRTEDEVGRLSGEDFVVVIQADGGGRECETVAVEVLTELDRPFSLACNQLPLSLTAIIGIAERDDFDGERMLRDADIALYRAKASRNQRFARFVPSMEAALEDRQLFRHDLSSAVESEEFFLLYQPTFSLVSGGFKGVEALLRWRHPAEGVVTPDRFVPALESSGLILEVGRWVLDRACVQAAAWNATGIKVSMSVNLSLRQLERDRIVEDVERALVFSGLDPASLILELTETALMRYVDATVRRLNLLKALGVRLAIDDFGTGYSSLSYLAQFPFDVVKIDKSFVENMTHTAKTVAIIRTFVELGKAVGLEVVAEGIENRAQLDMLVAEGVDTGQGYLFGRPMESAEVDLLLCSATGGRPRSPELTRMH